MSNPGPYLTMQDVIGGTLLVRLQRLPGPENERRGNVLFARLQVTTRLAR